MIKYIAMLCIVCCVTASHKMRGSYHFETLGNIMTAQMDSTQDYDVTQLPISIRVAFSESVLQFDPSQCITVNAKVSEITKQSDTTYIVSLIPDKPGFLSITLAKSIVSNSQASLMNPPIMEFSYVGASILTTRIMTVQTTTATISITTDRPVRLWGLHSATTTTIRPSPTLIMSQGQMISESSTTNHVFIISSLQPETKYSIYFAGKENNNVLMNNETPECLMTLTTRGESTDEDYDSKGDGTVCESGWGLSKQSKTVELLPCSYHGYCKQKKCICTEPYTSSNCASIIEESLSHTNSTHQLIHIRLQLWGTFKSQSKFDDYWRISIREIVADRLSLSPTLIQIRHWNYLQTSVKALSLISKRHLVGRHNRHEILENEQQIISIHLTIVTDHDMLELVTKRVNEMVDDNNIKQGMNGKYLTVSKVLVTHTFGQIHQDQWSCYDGMKSEDETDEDCGGNCKNGCMMQKMCNKESDCVSGLYCTKNKCIDRNWKQVIIASVAIVGIIIIVVVTIIFGGINYQKVKTATRRK